VDRRAERFFSYLAILVELLSLSVGCLFLRSPSLRLLVCVFITAGPITKLFAGGGGGEWTTCGTWYLVVAYRGNGGIHRGIYQLQGDDNGHVGRPR
jgi:hypothetical protein